MRVGIIYRCREDSFTMVAVYSLSMAKVLYMEYGSGN